MDSGIGMKKRMAQMAAAKKKAAAKEQKESMLSIGDCDIGASPQMQKGAIFSKRDGGGGKSSPIYQAMAYKLGRR